jgi:hypothetical protein
MEWLLVLIAFLLWRIATWAKQCATQLILLNGAVAEQQRHMVDGISRVENQVFDGNEKLTAIQDTTDQYYREFIKPLKGHY